MIAINRFLLILLCSASLSACLDGTSNNADGLVPVGALALNRTNTCTDYRRYIAQALTRRYLNQSPIYYPLIDIARADSELNLAVEAASASAAPDNVSQTNTQEAGVDEGDIVKVDSNGLIYTLGYGQLSIVKGFPAGQMELLSVLYQKDFNADELYIDEDQQTAILIGYGAVQRMMNADILPRQLNGTVIQFIDISDPTNPVIKNEYRLEGYRMTSRLIGQTLHLLTRYQVEAPADLLANKEFNQLLSDYYTLIVDPKAASSAGQDKTVLALQIERLITDAVTVADISELLPWLYTQTGVDNNYQDLVTCADIYLPELKVNPGLMAISSFSTDGQNISSVAVMNNAWITYATQTALYVAQTSNGWWWWADPGQQRNQSVVYKFDLTSGKPDYRGLASIVGMIKDRFSMSEDNGFLRVVASEQWYDEDENRMRSQHLIQILKENSRQLKLQNVGSTEPFGADEAVFAVRFVGDRGYVVTFRNIDPLFTFDLSDPAQPRLAGELEIPGFSTYMHPLDATHILTIGRGANLSQIQLQVFDVSNTGSPVQQFVHTLTTGENSYSWSPALYDPHAFTYYAPDGLLAIPYSYYDAIHADFYQTITSFKIDLNQGISELGAVRHDDLFRDAVCAGIQDTTVASYQSLCVPSYNYWYSAPRRAAYMTSGNETFLYTISNVGVKASPALDPATVINAVVLPVKALQ